MAIASIEVAFAHLGIKELVCFTAVSNKVSQHMMEKAGFKFAHNFTHNNVPHVLYQLTLRVFPQQSVKVWLSQKPFPLLPN